ncbi:fasciclin-3 isoform X2 [Fopius arisanus]|uniref:Fasciclin-3 isoform X2 n=1 Tax=Fopius arisanus TaxID=64838 RepID=A0A9R1U571_9HYME|nr:PREDICTED: fasciclin-3 isoform X2 [Fopius arisanus]
MERLRGNAKMILWSCFFVVVAVSAQGYNNPTVEVEPREKVVVKVGKPLRVMCRIGVPLAGCRVEIPGLAPIILKPNQPSDDGISYDGAGLETGQCGVTIANVKDSYHGDFKCALQPADSRSETIGSLKIIVAKPPPNRPELLLSQAPGERYKKGDRIEMSCSALAGRPSANVSLFLDNETLPRDNSRFAYNTNEDSMATVNASRILDWSDNGKYIRCVAEHIALDTPMEAHKQLQVYFPPQEQPTIERFGYVIGRAGIINATVYANPKPNFVWKVGDEEITEGRTDQSQRLQTTTARETRPGQWYVELKIDSVQKIDTEKFYVLEARNPEGTTKYHFRLSTSPVPEGFDLDAGFIIGIVVGILVLLLLISLIIFARATGRWCFAGGSSTRNIGESSDTESAGRYSRSETDGGSGRPKRPRIMLSQLFKRNKDKVAGSDTDTMRTVVTVDDEKTPESGDVMQKNQTAEGGLVYAELDLTQREATPPRRVSEDKTEYAEILYTKTEKNNEEVTDKK